LLKRGAHLTVFRLMFNLFLKVCFKILRSQVFTFKFNQLETKSRCLIEVAHSTHSKIRVNGNIERILVGIGEYQHALLFMHFDLI